MPIKTYIFETTLPYKNIPDAEKILDVSVIFKDCENIYLVRVDEDTFISIINSCKGYDLIPVVFHESKKEGGIFLVFGPHFLKKLKFKITYEYEEKNDKN